jgi:hypothetical protein
MTSLNREAQFLGIRPKRPNKVAITGSEFTVQGYLSFVDLDRKPAST